MLRVRRNQASKSILIQVDDGSFCNCLHEYLSSFGEIQFMYHYTTKENFQFALVEMADPEAASHILELAKKPGILTKGPLKIPYFKTSKKRRVNSHELNDNVILNTPINRTTELFTSELHNAQLSLKMVEFYQQSTISDLGYRLRFLTCNQIEQILKTVDPSFIVLPFGSSVNGFGNNSGDLDMVALSSNDSSNENEMEWTRETEQAVVITAFDLIKKKLPGSDKTVPIPKARVPLVKYHHKYTSLDCDLSFYRKDSMIMSELLYFFSTLDPRVKPLVFYIREWAKKMELTNDSPGKWISNFALTLLVLFFLQRRNSSYSIGMVPPWDKFSLERKHLLPNDVYTSLFNRYYKEAVKNEKSLEELLLQFFVFYSEFDYQVGGFSLRSGKIVKKSSGSIPLYIENPLFPDLNVSPNVTWREVKRIQKCMKDALEELNSRISGSQLGVLEIPSDTKRRKKSKWK